MKTYLFSYDFQGARYSLEIQASSQPEAMHKLDCMSRAKYDGEVMAKIYLGPWDRLLHWLGLMR